MAETVPLSSSRLSLRTRRWFCRSLLPVCGTRSYLTASRSFYQFHVGKGCLPVVAMAGTGKFFVGGNWKCNETKESISKLVSDLINAKFEDDVGRLPSKKEVMTMLEWM